MAATAARQQHVAQPQPQPLPAPQLDLLPPPPVKRRTVATNAQAIDTMGAQLFTMSQLLEKISDKVGAGSVPTPSTPAAQPPPSPAPPQPPAHAGPQSAQAATPAAFLPQHFPQTCAPFLAPPPGIQLPGFHPLRPHSAIDTQSFLPSYAQPSANTFLPLQARSSGANPPLDPLGSGSAQQPAHSLPASLLDIEDNSDLQDRVTQMLTTTLAPLTSISGKKLYAHSFVKRGTKKARTTLGDLSLPEYNTGFIKLMNSKNVSQADRPFMFLHLGHINEDAAIYEWEDVRYWSEEVCALVAEGDMPWSDRYNIDLLRLKFSQQRRKIRESRDSQDASRSDGHRGDGFHLDLTPELRAAKPAPPCRAFNNGTCPSKAHHVSNGFRHLHVCAFCIYHKCAPLPHGEKDCCSKQFKRNKPKESESGFGK